MKKIIYVFLIMALFVQSVFASEYSKIYTLIVPESLSYLTLNGGLGDVWGTSSQLNYSQNIIELTATGGAFTIDSQADASYRLYNQSETNEFDIMANSNLRLGTGITSLIANVSGDYTSYDLEFGSMPGFWYVGGGGNVNANSSSFTFSVSPVAALGIGRVYSIYNVYRAKLMMEYLGVTPTVEKVEAVVAVFQKTGEIFNKFSDDSTQLYKDYYQQLATAMGIENRALDVLILNTWNSQKYAYDRARFVSMINGWDALLAVSGEYNKFASSSSSSIGAGPEARIGGFLMDDMLYYDASGEFKINYVLNGSVSFNISGEGKLVYLPENYRWWAEAIADIDYIQGAVTPFQFDLSGAGYYLINNNFKAYAGLRVDEAPGLYLFAGGEIRFW